MILLVSDGLGFRALMKHPIYGRIGEQFEHVDWIGVHFYDLIAPAFLFMVGMSMPYSLGRRTEQGAGFRDNLRHMLLRFLRLMALSQILISITSNRLHFQMHNILTHIAVACLVCFAVMQWKFRYQVAAAAVLLAVHTAPFFLFPAPDGPFTKTGNIAAVWDRAIMGYNYKSWTTNWNMVSTSVSALFGMWAGRLLRSGRPRSTQMKVLAICMVAGWAGGLALSPLVPFIRRIWTASLVLFSAGWVILMLLALWVLIEVAGWRKLVFPLSIAGSNAIFIYSLEMLLRGWLDKSVAVFTGRFTVIGTLAPVAQSCAVLLVMWSLCYWLYRKRIFLRL